MLTVTDTAATEIRTIIDHPQVSDDAGVRIASGPQGDLTLAVTDAPADGDAVVDESGARVFVESQVEQLLSDKTLDAETDTEGNVSFTLLEQR